MGAITNKCFELIEEGRYVEQPRKKYSPLPNYFDCLDGRGAEEGTGESVGLLGDATEGKPKEDISNPLRRGDNSTII